MILKQALSLGLVLTVIQADMLEVWRPKTIQIHKLESCRDEPNSVVYLKDVQITYLSKLHMVSMKVISKDNVPGGLKLKLNLQRCKSREALDSCEKYQTINLNHLCTLLNAENKPWTPLVKLSDPPMGCPIVKGVRTVKNGTFDGSAFAHLPISGWYWIVNAYVLGEETDRLIVCVHVEGQIVPV